MGHSSSYKPQNYMYHTKNMNRYIPSLILLSSAISFRRWKMRCLPTSFISLFSSSAARSSSTSSIEGFMITNFNSRRLCTQLYDHARSNASRTFSRPNKSQRKGNEITNKLRFLNDEQNVSLKVNLFIVLYCLERRGNKLTMNSFHTPLTVFLGRTVGRPGL